MSQTKAQLLDGSVVSVSFGAGSAAAPSINYSADTTTGIYFPAATQLAFSTAGVQRLAINGTGNVNIPGTFSVTGQITAASGSVSTPSILLNGGGNPGIYSPAANQLAIVGSGATLLTASSVAIASTVPFTAPAGSATATTVAVGTGTTYAPGIYSPGTDQVAISTNGTGRLFVDASGNVGIGTGSGSGGLAVGVMPSGTWGSTPIAFGKYGAANPTYPFIVSTNSQSLDLGNNARWDGTNWVYQFASAITATRLNLQYNSLTYYNAAAGTAGSTITWLPSLTVDSSGRLGLGISGPLVLLHGTTSVSATTEYAGVGFLENSLNNVDTGATIAYPVLKLTRAGKSGVSYRSSAQFGIARYEAVGTAARTRLDIALGHGDVAQPDTTVMSLLSSGAVGINTTGPTSRISVAGGTTQAADFTITGNNNASGTGIVANFSAGGAGDPATTKGAYINCGASSVGNAYFGIDGSYPGIIRVKTDYPTVRDLLTIDPIGSIVFLPAGTEKARIDSSGRLLVGGSPDSGGALLQVFGDRIRIGTAKTPASATATGTTGEIAWDANYIYVCTATNTWKRVAISTW